IGEEWGFAGVCVIVLCYTIFIVLGFRIARTAGDRFGMLLATGLTALIGISAVVHMAVSLALVPTTGLPLPFLSYGRSNLLVSIAAAGTLVSIGERRGRPR
ncbi:MAG: FtsW/RodA/SpoVE family cell cycle protein, partial [Candidatus Methanoperedens sp.]|nr:FtsW/RodA/SpoVE family cell cycle protein [Candidatus Methanoperedens sp.]